MLKSRKSRKIKKATSLKEPICQEEDEDRSSEFQQYFNSIIRLIEPLRKIENLANPKIYE